MPEEVPPPAGQPEEEKPVPPPEASLPARFVHQPQEIPVTDLTLSFPSITTRALSLPRGAALGMAAAR